MEIGFDSWEALLRMSDYTVFGFMDIFFIGGVAGLLLYYFVFRKTKKEVPSFKKLTVGYHALIWFVELQ